MKWSLIGTEKPSEIESEFIQNHQFNNIAQELRNVFYEGKGIISPLIELAGLKKLYAFDCQALTQPLLTQVQRFIQVKPTAGRCWYYATNFFNVQPLQSSMKFDLPLEDMLPIPLNTIKLEMLLYNQALQSFEWVMVNPSPHNPELKFDCTHTSNEKYRTGKGKKEWQLNLM